MVFPQSHCDAGIAPALGPAFTDELPVGFQLDWKAGLRVEAGAGLGIERSPSSFESVRAHSK